MIINFVMGIRVFCFSAFLFITSVAFSQDINYKYDKDFVSGYFGTVELKQGDRRVLLSADLQGRILTSSAEGDSGKSFGWINYDLISSGKFDKHINNFGGEDRFWMGPEGGQYSLFFPKGSDFGFEDWQTPSPVDTEKWSLKESTDSYAVFSKDMSMINYSGNVIKCNVDRKVVLLSDTEIQKIFGVKLPSEAKTVAFESLNTVTNTGDNVWSKKSGMPSIWILGQYMVSDNNFLVIPCRESVDSRINDVYFGKVDDDRLMKVDGGYIFRCDGLKRGKIGIPPAMTVPLAAAYDFKNEVLTIVSFSFDEKKRDYVNSLWELQDEPFKGDVLNAYNDGPLEDGTIMGPFYEIESSSAALDLAPGQKAQHRHAIAHISVRKDDAIEIIKKICEIDLSFLAK